MRTTTASWLYCGAIPEGIPLWKRDGHGAWVDQVIMSAMERISQRYEGGTEVETSELYDNQFAHSVLEEINKRFPNSVQTHELKFAFSNEPSDTTLLTALAGLERDGYITGKSLFNYTTRERRLFAMGNIEITTEGRRYLSGELARQNAAVIHGDQIINYGNAGAIGRNAIGTISYQYKWESVSDNVDLSALTAELKTLKSELMKIAKVPSDFQQLSMVAEAEQYAERQDGQKVMEVLSKSGKWLFNFATEVGTDITAKLMAKAMGLEP